mgnify:CR=1 FL=1
MEKQKNAVGRRKEAITRVFLSRGEGKITVNGKDYKTYFPLVYLQNQVEAPLKTTEMAGKFDIVINATGGGVKGQAEAAKLGIARALIEVNVTGTGPSWLNTSLNRSGAFEAGSAFTTKSIRDT